MNSIVLWVGGLACTALGWFGLHGPYAPPFLAAGLVLFFLAAALSLGGHNDD